MAQSYFPESHGWSEISSLSRVILVLGKARSHGVPNLGCRGPESPGWLDVLPKKSVWDMMHERACCHDEAVSHQLPIAVDFWIIQIVSTEECSSFMQNLMQICCSTRSVIFEYDSHTVHMFTQLCLLPPLTSTVKLSLFTHAHSRPLLATRIHWYHANYSLILTMVKFFQDRPCIFL